MEVYPSDGDITIAGLGLLLAPVTFEQEGNATPDLGSRFHPKTRPIESPFSTCKGYCTRTHLNHDFNGTKTRTADPSVNKNLPHGFFIWFNNGCEVNDVMNFLVDYFPCNLRSTSFKLRYIPTGQIHNLLGHLTENNLFVIFSVFSIHSNFTQSTNIVFTRLT